METAWVDGDVLSEDESNWSDEPLKESDEDSDGGILSSASRCNTFKWWGETSSDNTDAWVEWKRAAERIAPVVDSFPPIVLSTWTYCEPVERLCSSTWQALHALGEVVDELVAEPPFKSQDVAAVTAEFDAHLKRLFNLRHRLPPQGEDGHGYDEDDDGGKDAGLLVDWRELNRVQLAGWPSPIQDENGSPLTVYRPASFGTSPLEVEDDEPFLE
jgi:hypothetical protein